MATMTLGEDLIELLLARGVVETRLHRRSLLLDFGDGAEQTLDFTRILGQPLFGRGNLRRIVGGAGAGKSLFSARFGCLDLLDTPPQSLGFGPLGASQP